MRGIGQEGIALALEKEQKRAGRGRYRQQYEKGVGQHQAADEGQGDGRDDQVFDGRQSDFGQSGNQVNARAPRMI